jgi:hypothetical protein
MGDWKAVRTKKGLELFNLADDIGEQNDVAAQHPDLVEKAETIMEDAHEYSPFFDWEYEGPLPGEGR